MFNIFDLFFLNVDYSKRDSDIDAVLELSRVLPIVGYLLIFMTLIDFINVLTPLQLQNPEWELVTLSKLSDHSWAFLIGTGFALTGFFSIALARVRLIEVLLLRVIRWGLLLLGGIYLVSLLLVINNTNRLVSQVKTNFLQQIQAKEEIINQVEANINTIDNPSQLLQIAQTLSIPIPNPGAPPEQIQQQIQQKLPQLRQQVPEQAARAENKQIKALIQRSLRTAIQLFVIAIGNTLVWFKTRDLKSFFP